jgi:hypothetical protein
MTLIDPCQTCHRGISGNCPKEHWKRNKEAEEALMDFCKLYIQDLEKKLERALEIVRDGVYQIHSQFGFPVHYEWHPEELKRVENYIMTGNKENLRNKLKDQKDQDNDK